MIAGGRPVTSTAPGKSGVPRFALRNGMAVAPRSGRRPAQVPMAGGQVPAGSETCGALGPVGLPGRFPPAEDARVPLPALLQADDRDVKAPPDCRGGKHSLRCRGGAVSATPAASWFPDESPPSTSRGRLRPPPESAWLARRDVRCALLIPRSKVRILHGPYRFSLLRRKGLLSMCQACRRCPACPWCAPWVHPRQIRHKRQLSTEAGHSKRSSFHWTCWRGR